MADSPTNPNPRPKRRRRPRGKAIPASAPKAERVQQMMSPRPGPHKTRTASGRKLAYSEDRHSDLFVDAILDTPIVPGGLTIIVPVEGPPVITITNATSRDIDQLMTRIDVGTAHFAAEVLIEALRDINTMLAASDEATLEIVQPPQTI